MSRTDRPLVNWFAKDCLPFWAQSVFDDALGFVEGIQPDGTAMVDYPRRMRVQARCIHTFASTALNGLFPDGADLAIAGFNHWIKAAFPDGIDAGGIHQFDAHGQIANSMRDLYDQAFSILACASIWRLTKDPRAHEAAEAIFIFLETNLASPAGGWLEDDRGHDAHESPRRQNPHMHLFEAFMAAYRAFDEPAWKERAARVFRLFETVFFDPDAHVLREFFDENWSVHPVKGSTIEPGHMMEWTYLLAAYETISGIDTRDYRASLFDGALALQGRTDEDPPRLLPDAVDLNTGVASDAGRLWVQTEYLRALCVMAHDRPHLIVQTEELEQLIIDRHIAPFKVGLWCDALAADGEPAADYVPASILYHLYETVIVLRETDQAVDPAREN